MIITRFLDSDEYPVYGDWLKSQDQETLHTYFGAAVSEYQIDQLIKSVMSDITKHHFLVAEQNHHIVGSIHISESAVDEVEFGVMVAGAHRGQGLGDRLISEAITWSRNRGYHSLYMHCLSWNSAIKHLCTKHGLKITSQGSESETKTSLPPANIFSVSKELGTVQRNIYRRLLQRNIDLIQEIYG